MKQLVIIKLIILLFLSSSISTSAQEKNRILNNGFSIKCIVGFMPNSYAWIEGEASSNRKMGYLFGGQIGNRWYMPIKNRMAFGAMVNWLEVTVTQMKKSGDTDWRGDGNILDVTILGTGPIFTYAFNQKTGIDAFYNIRPTVFDDSAIAASHSIGLGLRRNAMMINFEYVFGKNPSGEYINSKPVDKNINHSRVSFGFKF